jgi:tetratricopeptide (TPR) repeat protein
MGLNDLKGCSACNAVYYCCKDHQLEHWKGEGHKMVCKGRKEGKAPSFDELAAAAQKYLAMKSWRLALMNFGAMLELTEQQMDNTYHPQCANILERIAMCYKNLEGGYPKAIHAYTRVLLIRDFNNHDNDPAKCADAFRVMGQWAECFVHLGQFELARDAFKKIEQTAIEYFGDQSMQRGQAFQALGTVYVELGQWKEAEVVYKLALSLDKFGKATDSTALAVSATCHFNLGLLCSAQDRHAEAAAALELCLDKKLRAGAKPDDAGLVEAQAALAEAKAGRRVADAPVAPPPRPAAAEAAAGGATAAAEAAAAPAAAAV